MRRMRCPAIGDNSTYWFIVARKDLELSDDWDMASMVATGRVTIDDQKTFVTDGWCSNKKKLMSATGPALVTFQQEDAIAQSFFVLSRVRVHLPWAGGRRGELGRESCEREAFGIPRIERIPPRHPLGQSYEAARVARILRGRDPRGCNSTAQSGQPRIILMKPRMGRPWGIRHSKV